MKKVICLVLCALLATPASAYAHADINENSAEKEIV